MAGLALAAGGTNAQAQELPLPPTGVCSGDVVFFIDTSGSMCLGRLYSEPDPANNEQEDFGVVDAIRDAIEALNALPERNFKFTVYYGRDFFTSAGTNDPQGQAILDLYNLSIDNPNSSVDLYTPNLQVLPIRPAVVDGRDDPGCLTRSNLMSRFGDLECYSPLPDGPCSTTCTESEDWGNALAHIALYNAPTSGSTDIPVSSPHWRYSYSNCVDRYSRIYFPVSDEGPRCGNACIYPNDPLAVEPYGNPDWRSVVDASVCAVNNGVRAIPITGCCSPLDPPQPFTPPPIPDPKDPTTGGAPCTVSSCVTTLASTMAGLTTANPNRFLVSVEWDSAQIGQFIFSQVEQEMCNNAALFSTCDSIDFNNDTLFPSDDDLVDFLFALAGQTCPTCNDIDFNNDCLFPDDNDLIAFLSVLAGGPCF